MSKDMRLAALFAALLLSTGASAQLFKCKGPDGKIVYSDSRCEAESTHAPLPVGVANRAHANEEKAAADKAASKKELDEARIQAEARVAAEVKLMGGVPVLVVPGAPAGAAAPAKAPEPVRNRVEEEQRIRNLQSTAGQFGATAEQQAAARLEAQMISEGRDARLTSAQRERRDSLTVDLRSVYPNKRREALDELRSLYR